MDGFATLITSVGPVLWPVFAIIALVIFAKPLKDLLVSIVNRNVKVKIGNTEVEIGELTKQQNQLISDVVTELARRSKSVAPAAAPPQLSGSGTKRVLWVDDTPLNNASAASIISSAGFDIDQAVTTSQGLELFSKRHYDFVITDMGRKECTHFNQLAGIELTRKIRAIDNTTPILVYTTGRSVQQHGEEARKSGATKVTASAMEIMETLLV